MSRPGLRFPAAPPGAAHARCGSRRLPAAPGAEPAAAQGSSVRLPAVPAALPGAAPGHSRCGSQGGFRCSSQWLPVRLPARQTPGAPSGADGRAPGLILAHPSLTTGPGAELSPGTHPQPRRHAPRASLDAGGGEQPPGAGGGLG